MTDQKLEKAAREMMKARDVEFPYEDPEEEAAAIANAVADLEVALRVLAEDT